MLGLGWADFKADDKKQLEKVAKRLNNAFLILQGIKNTIESHKRNVFTKAELTIIAQQLNTVINELNQPGEYKDKADFIASCQNLMDAFNNYPAHPDTPSMTVKLLHTPEIARLMQIFEKRVKKDEEKAQKTKKEFSLASFSDNPFFYAGRYAASTVFNENVSYYVGPVLSALFLTSVAQAWLASPLVGAPLPIQATSSVLSTASQGFGYIPVIGSQFAELVSGNPIVAKLLQVPYLGSGLQYLGSTATGAVSNTLGSVAGLATHSLSAMATATNLIWYVGVPYACLRVVSAFFEVLEQAKKLVAPAIQGVKDSISIIGAGISGIASLVKMGASFISAAFSGLKSLWKMSRTPRNYAALAYDTFAPNSSTVKAVASLPAAAAANVWAYTGQPVINAGKGAMVTAYTAYKNGYKAAAVAPAVVVVPPTSPQKLRA